METVNGSCSPGTAKILRFGVTRETVPHDSASSMTTIIIQIDNADNKLTQVEWTEFVDAVEAAVRTHGGNVHFFGGSPNWTVHQNVAWVLDCDRTKADLLKEAVREVRIRFRQDAAAWTEGETLFI